MKRFERNLQKKLKEQARKEKKDEMHVPPSSKLIYQTEYFVEFAFIGK